MIACLNGLYLFLARNEGQPNATRVAMKALTPFAVVLFLTRMSCYEVNPWKVMDMVS